MPVTVIAGPDQTRSAEAARADERQAGLDLGQVAELVVAVRRARPLVAPEALRRRRRRCRRAASRARGSARAARRARRRRTGRCASARRASRPRHDHGAMPRRPIVSVGTPGRTLPMSPMIIASARTARVASAGSSSSALPISSWPSITILIADRRPAVPGAQRADVQRGCSTSCRPRRARRSRRRARSPRTAATPTSPRRPRRTTS